MHDFLYKDGENLFITQLYIFKCLKINCDRDKLALWTSMHKLAEQPTDIQPPWAL